MDFKAFLAIGEETTRHTKEATTVGFVPLTDYALPDPDFKPKKRGEFRGESSRLGHTTERRMGVDLKGSFKFPLFTEAGTTKGIVATLFKHLFGKATTAQNASTGQYASMIYGVSDPWAAANLGTKALTLNFNIMEGDVLKNYPVLGARPTKIKVEQKPGEDAQVSVDFIAQEYGATTAGLGSPVFPAENLRCDFSMFRLYTGAVTRTGTPPDYTNIVQNAATQIKPDEFSIEFDPGIKDKMVLDGNKYPTKTNVGIITGKASLKMDWEDPSSGFSSVDEYNAWRAAVSAINLLALWDTGVQAGTGLNHQVIMDVPIANRKGGKPNIKQDADPDISLEWDFHYDATTTLYIAGVLFLNTASSC